MNLPVLHLSGTPRERGETYGEQARGLIRTAAARWREELRRSLPVSVEEHLDRLVHQTGFVRRAQQLTPDLLEEVAGISAASGVERAQVLALNLMDEDWWLRRRYGCQPAQHCTAIGTPAAHGMGVIVGQNMDLPPWMDGLQILLSISDSASGQSLLVPTIAGMIATNAMNSHGVAICVNTLNQLPSSTDGLPVAFIVRRVGQARTLSAAVATVRALPHASGQNYLLGAPDGVHDLEAAATGVRAFGGAGVLIHTNHPLVDWPLLELIESTAHLDDSRRRLDQVTRQLTEGAASVESIKQVMRLPPICRPADDHERRSVYSVLMHPQSRTLEMTAGPPDRNDYELYRLAHGIDPVASARSI